METDARQSLERLGKRIVRCARCPRLVAHREATAAAPPRRYRGERYWARPLPGFGDPRARLLLVGLAPAAHGGNRTGRVFTGDRSGDFLFAGLYRAGFANQPESRSRDDGLRLHNCYITAAVRCCPPANKPSPPERADCRPYLEAELRLLTRLRAVLALGRLAHDTFLGLLRDRGHLQRLADFPFRHGVFYDVPSPGDAREPGTIRLFDSFHPSQQNTQTGRLTAAMLDHLLGAVCDCLGG